MRVIGRAGLFMALARGLSLSAREAEARYYSEHSKEGKKQKQPAKVITATDVKYSKGGKRKSKRRKR